MADGPPRGSRAVRGFPGYFVTRDGMVYSVRWSRNLLRWDNDGYPAVTLRVGTVKKNRRVHQLVAPAFLGRKPSKRHEVRHIDGNPQNCHYKNLRWGTHTQNMRDMISHGRSRRGTKRPDLSGDNHHFRKNPELAARGEATNHTKLTSKQIPVIRRMVASGRYSCPEVAARYGVCRNTILAVKKRRTWKHIP